MTAVLSIQLSKKYSFYQESKGLSIGELSLEEIRKIYKIYLSYSIVDLCSTIKYIGIVYMLIKVYITIQNKEMTHLNIFSHICFYYISSCYKSLIDTFIIY